MCGVRIAGKLQQRPVSQRDQQQSKPVWDIPRPIMQSWSNFITSLNNQQNPDQSASGTLESSPIHYILQSWCHATCQSSRILHKRTTMHGACCNPFSCQDTTNTRSCQVSFLLHNPIAFKKSWHVPAIKAEEMVEG